MARHAGNRDGLNAQQRAESGSCNRAPPEYARSHTRGDSPRRQAMDMLADVGADNVAVHLDTYHMNIEERSMAAAVAACGDRLGCGSPAASSCTRSDC